MLPIEQEINSTEFRKHATIYCNFRTKNRGTSIKMYFEIDFVFNGKHADRYYVFVGLTPTRSEKDVRKLRKKMNLNPVGFFNNLFI